MNTQQEAAMRKALEALKPFEKMFREVEARHAGSITETNIHCQISVHDLTKCLYAVGDLTAAVEQPVQQEPVACAWAKQTDKKLRITTMPMSGEDGWRPLGYIDTRPQAREPLTDEQIEKLAEQVGMCIDKYGLAVDAENGLEDGVDAFGFARAIEAAHGIKENT